jgi:radical SAM superfamily enzyme YgiQ (UPF0313 family)
MPTAAPILIAAINARHSHASMGARCLLANMDDLRNRTELLEFTIQQSAAEIAAAIATRNPLILALGVYIWNALRVAELLPLLRHKSPEMKIVLGGPEITEDTTSDFQPCCSRPRWGRESDHTDADGAASLPNSLTATGVNAPGYNETALNAEYYIFGEGDLAFPALCHDILASHPCSSVSIRGCLRPPPPDLSSLQLPYAEYTDSDLAHRLLYVESSRGCAMRCDYCVSANDPSVRFFPMPALLAAFDKLLSRGAQQFKFCDRSFNLDIPRAIEILSFFLERLPRFPGLFLHFEMLPDRFPTELRDILARFPPRSLQLEIGLQSLNPDVLERIRRPQNLERAEDNLRFLREHTHAFLHVDLIAGLPGERPESFATGFDRLVALGPHEIQLGILKKLPGAPIARHDDEFAMRYHTAPPYEILSTRDWPAEHLARTARFAHYWDAIVSSNRFLAAAPLIWKSSPSIFDAFLAFSDWMGSRFPQEHGVPLPALVEAVFDFLTQARGISPEIAAAALIRGYRHSGARDIPPALAPHLRHEPPPPTRDLPKPLRRQFLRWTWDESNPTL